MKMWKSGFSFAEVVANNKGGIHICKFARNANENLQMYVNRIKKEIVTENASGPFRVFSVSRERQMFMIAARNEHVAKVMVIGIIQSRTSVASKAAEQKYVNFAISDPDEGYRIGVCDDMDVVEASRIALLVYRKTMCRQPNKLFEWIHASVVQTNESRDTEGQVLL